MAKPVTVKTVECRHGRRRGTWLFLSGEVCLGVGLLRLSLRRRVRS